MLAGELRRPRSFAISGAEGGPGIGLARLQRRRGGPGDYDTDLKSHSDMSSKRGRSGGKAKYILFMNRLIHCTQRTSRSSKPQITPSANAR